MELEKFRDEAVNKSLYKFQAGEDVPMSLLRTWDGNSYFNQDMARIVILIDGVISTYPETLRNGLQGFTERLPILLAGIDDHRATMAIEALGKATLIGQQAEEKKKGGIMGFFSGGKK